MRGGRPDRVAPCGAAALMLAAALLTGATALRAQDAPAADEDASAPRNESSARKDDWWNNEGGAQPAPAPAKGGAETTPAPASAPGAPAELATVPVAAPAAEPVESKTVLEDITVTSQKRVQSIQDVPISVTALTGQMLWEQGATDVREALQFTPNARVDSAGFFAAPRVRGFTLNNNNKSFEPPVGMVLDGIPHTRVEYFMAALMDLERIEVLRGPQGTSFGKNTTAGLVHLISNPPGPASSGMLMLETGELNRRRIEGAYGAALTGGLNFRVAGLLDERDGFIENTSADVIDSAPDELKDRRRTGLRLALEAPEFLGSSVLVAHESYQLYDGGAALEFIRTGPAFRDAVRSYDPDADFTPGNWTHSQDYPDFRDASIERTRFQVDRGIGGWEVVVLGAYSVLDQSLMLDTDFTPAAGIQGGGSDHSPETYGEVRFTAPTAEGLLGVAFLPGESELLFGVSGGRRQILDSHFVFGINNRPFFHLVGGAGTDTGDPPDPGNTGGLLGGAPTGEDKYDEMDQKFEQSSDELSGFAHLQYKFLPSWAVELGGRYTTEKKSALWDMSFTTPEPNTSLRAVGAEPFTATRSMDLENFQPKVSLNWTPWRALSVFAHWEKGYKAGGFNAFAFREGTCDPADPSDTDCQNGFEVDDLVFRDEVATNWGLDVKTWLFDRTANVNLSFFRETAEDFQVLIRENPAGTIGLGTSRVVNAEEAESKGVEMDLRWLVTDWLNVTGGLGLLDTEFVSFKFGECPVGNSNKDSDGDGNPACDQSGKPFPFAPEIGGALGVRVNLPLTGVPLIGSLMDGLNLTTGTVAEYESTQLLDIDLDEKKRQDEYWRFKADLGVTSIARRWTVRLVGENLTDTVTWVRMGDVFEGVVNGSQNQPRLLYLQLRQEF